jgi:hypothetical protein
MTVPTDGRVAAVLLLAVRGVLLWIVVPLGAVAWLLAAPSLRRRGIGVGRFLGWLDLNLVAALQRSVLRPLFDVPRAWTPWGAASSVEHRISRVDPV